MSGCWNCTLIDNAERIVMAETSSIARRSIRQMLPSAAKASLPYLNNETTTILVPCMVCIRSIRLYNIESVLIAS